MLDGVSQVSIQVIYAQAPSACHQVCIAHCSLLSLDVLQNWFRTSVLLRTPQNNDVAHLLSSIVSTVVTASVEHASFNSWVSNEISQRPADLAEQPG